MIRTFSCLLYLSLGFLVACSSQPKPTALQADTTPVVLEASEIFTITASNQRQYRIQVRYPGSYAEQPSKTYPVIIKIDGQWDFPLAASVVNNIYFDGQMPEALVIGIDWVDTSPDLQAVRMRDLSPVPAEGVESSGQAAAFAKLLAEDIAPDLAKRFRTNGQVYLLGGSLGANFATFALLEQPQAFSGAIAIGGNYGNSRAVYQQLFRKHAGGKALENKRLYLGVGAADGAASQVNALAEEIKKARLTGLTLKLDVLAGYGHSGMNVPGYAAGYKYIFERPQLKLSKEYLKTLAGTYSPLNGRGEPVNIQLTEQGLSVTRYGEAMPLHAQSPNEFYYEGEFFNLAFTMAEAKINLRIDTFFGSGEYSRMEAR